MIKGRCLLPRPIYSSLQIIIKNGGYLGQVHIINDKGLADAVGKDKCQFTARDLLVLAHQIDKVRCRPTVVAYTAQSNRQSATRKMAFYAVAVIVWAKPQANRQIEGHGYADGDGFPDTHQEV